MLIRLLLLLIICLSGLQVVFAQNTACYTDEIVSKLRQQDHLYDRELRQIENGSAPVSGQRSGGVLYTIPVVFHVVLNTNAQLNSVSYQRITQQLETLNNDFRRLNADAVETRSIFKNIAADVEIEFCLARQDPNGNQADGITKTLTAQVEWDRNSETNDMKFDATGGHDAWDPQRYMNIWIVDIAPTQTSGGGTVAGYAYIGTASRHGTSIDGIVLDYQIGFGSTDRSLTHEVGHYMGLLHPWGSGSGGCNNDDGINDTPLTSDENYGCDTLTNSCNENPDLPDQVENHMDYSTCPNMFSLGQKEYMRFVLVNFRTSLLSSFGCQSIANFVSSEPSGCDSAVITFTDQSLNNPTAWNWSFPGGDPMNSTQSNPTVTYRNNGNYDVTLSITNNDGTYSSTFYNYVNIYHSPSGNLVGTNAVCAGVDDGAIELTVFNGKPPYSYSWSNGATSQNLLNIAPNFYQVTITDDLNCSSTNSININQDNALELISVTVPDSAGSGLGTISVSIQGGVFPVSYQWDDLNTSTTSAISGLTAGRYTVTAVDANGCLLVKGFDIYDRAPVTTSTGSFNLSDVLSVYPNPTNGKITVEINQPVSNGISIEVFNSIGHIVDQKEYSPAKNINLNYSLDNFRAGIYYLKITAVNGSVTKRIVLLK